MWHVLKVGKSIELVREVSVTFVFNVHFFSSLKSRQSFNMTMNFNKAINLQDDMRNCYFLSFGVNGIYQKRRIEKKVTTKTCSASIMNPKAG